MKASERSVAYGKRKLGGRTVSSKRKDVPSHQAFKKGERGEKNLFQMHLCWSFKNTSWGDKNSSENNRT